MNPTMQEVREFKDSPVVKAIEKAISDLIDEGDLDALKPYIRLREKVWTDFLQRKRRSHL